MILKEVRYLLDIALKTLNSSYADIRMLELGNQMMRCHKVTSKSFFLSKGIKEHQSIDLNGKGKSLRLDLNSPIDAFNNYFDITTDFGTLEHVSNQYEAFKNIHNLTRTGGVIIHTLPLLNYWKGHCCFYYEPVFFNNLYKSLIVNEIIEVKLKRTTEKMICVVALKDSYFPLEEAFKEGLHEKDCKRFYSSSPI